jgi:PST family polysaccharide transporter/lipopolysaccharide exporter
VWGLAAGYLAQLVVSYRIHSFRPRFRFDWGRFRALSRYGVWMNLHGVATLAATHGASIVVGRLIDVPALGLYQMAHWITQSAVVEVATALSGVAFPAYAQIQEDLPRVRSAFVRASGVILAVTLPTAAGLLLLGDLFVATALGASWAEMGGALRLLAIAAALNAVALCARPIFLGVGAPRALFLMQAAGALVLLAAVVPLSRAAGIAGAAAAMIASGAAMCATAYPSVGALVRLRAGDVGQAAGPALLATAAMCALVAPFALWAQPLRGAPAIAALAGLVALGGAAYLAALRAIAPRFPDNRPLDALSALRRPRA